MSKILRVIASLMALLTLTLPLPAQSPNWFKVGGLGCTMSPTIGLLVVSEQKLNCKFTPDGPYPPENYTGTMGTVGPTQGPPQGSLSGTYGGASGSIAAGVGVGANVLLGGSARSVMLQPISVEGSVGIEVTLGVAALTLQWVP